MKGAATWTAVGVVAGGFGSAALFLWLCYPRPPRDRDFVGLLFLAFAAAVGLVGGAVGGWIGSRLARRLRPGG